MGTTLDNNLKLALVWPGFFPPNHTYEQAGISYEVSVVRDKILLGYDCLPVIDADNINIDNKDVDLAENENDATELDWLDADNEKYGKYLRRLDPNNSKEQDHYKVLGISKLRHLATSAQIRTAYRRKVLKHHPDKRRARGVAVQSESEDYFACITHAYEQLGTTRHKRHAYDSIDPKFDPSTPTSADPDTFIETFSPVFERNARWSNRRPVPKLGDDNSDFDHVNAFYAFWFDFDSWREFSYLDEEDKDKGENRDERRWIDKQNKAAREKLRKDEVKRIRNLVENAYNCDPRVTKFKTEEKQKKEAEKEAKKRAKMEKKMAEEKARREAEEEERRKEEAEREIERQKQEEEKRQREAKKRELQKERKQLQNYCKDNNYFSENEAEQFQRMDELTKMCEVLSLEQLQTFNQSLRNSNGNAPSDIFQTQVETVNKLLEEESARLAAAKTKAAKSSNTHAVIWSDEEIQHLVKAVTLFPAGTKSRWEVIGQFITDHTTTVTIDSKPKTAKDVLNKTKELQRIESANVKSSSDSNAFKQFVGSMKKDESSQVQSGPTQRFESPSGDSIWTNDEQKLFEQALRTFVSNTPDRWDRVAECVQGKTKKECIRRFKELAELVRSKKAAQQKVAAASK